MVKHLEVFASPADSMFVWSVNGKEVQRGNGKNKLSYTLKPGNVHIRVILEYNGVAVPGQQQECQIQVESATPSQMNIKTGTSVPFDTRYFKGYNKYTWYLDRECSSGTEWTHSFGKAGNYRVELIAECFRIKIRKNMPTKGKLSMYMFNDNRHDLNEQVPYLESYFE